MNISDIEYYRKINGSYNTGSKREYQINKEKKYINTYFDEIVGYEQVKINDTDREVIIRNHSNRYKQDNGLKIITRPNETISLGDLILWKNKTWMCISLDPIDDFYTKGDIKQCNNMLKGYDKNGVLHKYPCVFDTKVVEADFDYRTSIITPDGRVKLYIKANDFTREIFENRRFIFNKQAYKVVTVENHNQVDINDSNTITFITIIMVKDQIAPDDDLINSIANVNQYKYTLSINQEDFKSTVGQTGKLSATLKLNDEIVTRELIWSSSDTSIATIDTNGNYNMLSNGNTIFKCALKDNELVFDVCNVTVESTPQESIQIIIEPNVNEILQGQSQVYTCKKLNNNVEVVEALIIQDVSVGIPTGYYTFSSNNNSFTIKNIKMYSKSKVKIKISDNNGHENTIEIRLKGAW